MAKERKRKQQELPFNRKNLYLLGIGLMTLVIGYILMAQPPVDSFWSLTLAPVVLLIGYLIIIPYAILYKDKKNEK
jgi:uncharacterized membrane protein HdeD (DUF308 family)